MSILKKIFGWKKTCSRCKKIYRAVPEQANWFHEDGGLSGAYFNCCESTMFVPVEWLRKSQICGTARAREELSAGKKHCFYC